MGLPLRHLNKGQASVTQPTVFWAALAGLSPQDGGPLWGLVGVMDTEMPYMLMRPREGLVCSQRASLTTVDQRSCPLIIPEVITPGNIFFFFLFQQGWVTPWMTPLMGSLSGSPERPSCGWKLGISSLLHSPETREE